LVNWRLTGLQQALADNSLRPLKDLISANDFRGERQAVNYAQARYFCLYLQEKGLLAQFFRTVREGHSRDPLGEFAVSSTFPDHSWDQLDEDFRRWVARLQR
jgi:hypothetical protein